MVEIIRQGDMDRKWKYACNSCGCLFKIGIYERVHNPITIECPCCGESIITDSGFIVKESNK